MRQLITRIDDDLHARLKERAAALGVSVNTYVADALRQAVGEQSSREALRARARAKGLLVEPPEPTSRPTWEELREAARGAGTAVSEALDADRAAR
jgi:antitoxin FitA